MEFLSPNNQDPGQLEENGESSSPSKTSPVRKSSLVSIAQSIGSFAGQITRRMSMKSQAARERDAQLDLTTQPKFLLLGPSESGKSTLSKQMKLIFGQGFTETDRKAAVREIRTDILCAIVYLVKEANEIDRNLVQDYSMYLKYEQRDDEHELLHDGLLSSCATLDAPTTISYENYEEFLEHSVRISQIWQEPVIKNLADRLPEANNRWK